MRVRKQTFGLCLVTGVIIFAVLPRYGDVAETPKTSEKPASETFQTEITFTGDDLEFFEKKVRPILVERCHKCHGDTEPKGELRLLSRNQVLKGGESGIAVIPGDVDNSELIKAINYGADSFQMPPKGKLPDDEIAVLTEWVKRKLPWTKSETTTAIDGTGKPPAISFEDRAKQWPFSPLDDESPPAPRNSAWGENIIDAYILSKLDEADLTPASRADKRTWLRRVTFDLIGLPPTPAEIDDFVADDAPDAYEKVTDRLLASPHYGERWARHWLDLVRYAESMGHEFDYDILYAWRYRDYVVRALNEGVPYDRFVVEHLAGDLLHMPRRDAVTGENESIKATAFYWLGQGKHSPVDIRAEECDTVDNQIDVFSKAFLGLTVACARCHDHKFDPISAADYYALAGFLQSSRQQWVDVSDPAQNRLLTHAMTTVRYDARKYGVTGQWIDLTDGERISQLLLELRPLLQQNLLADGKFPEPRLEGETLKIIGVTGGEARPQEMASFGKGQWSGDSHLWWTDGEAGKKLTLALPVEMDGKYHVQVRLTKARDYGIVQISLDGNRIGEPVDLYNPQVVPTGSISLGTHDWKAGEHRLTFEITGKNDKAAPGYMVGLDYVAVVPTSNDAASNHDIIARADARLLELVRRIQSRPDDTTDLLRPWHILSSATIAEEFQRRKVEFLEKWTSLQQQYEAQTEPQPDWTTFGSAQPESRWYSSGFAFELSPATAGQLSYVTEADHPRVDVVTHNGLHSGRLSRRFQGYIRSPTFPVKRKYIDYLVRRSDGNPNPGRANKNGNISLIVDGFQVIRNPLYGDLTFVVPNDGQWHWHRQNVSKHIGSRAYIEIGDEDDGYIEIAQIRSTDGPLSVTPPHPQILELLSDDAVATPEQLAVGYERLVRDAFQRMREGRQFASGDAELLQMLTELTTAGGSPALAQRLTDALQPLAKLEAEILPPVWALAMTEGTPEDEHVLIRGNHTKPGEIVERRFLEVFYSTGDLAYETASGRLELAEQMIADAKPLVARVIVNRLWQHHFGEGIVASPDNFGALGSPPSHPELLDALARELIAHDWSLKHIHRLIVNSATYRQSSQATDLAAEERDPTNRLLHRMNVKRLEGEPLRDAILALSGRINPQMFGPSVMPHLTPFMEGRGRPGESGPLDGDGRRSIYLGVRRNFLSPMFLAFDLPTPLSTMGKRSTSNVPAQALTLMNNPFVWEQSQMWATRLTQNDTTTDDRITRMYQEAFARPPTDEEHQVAASFLESAEWSDLTHLLINLKEFVFIP